MRKRIWVIDDDELLTKTFSRLLTRLNYDVFVTSRPEEAVQKAEAEDPDLILCDIRMPGKNGVETVREIHAKRAQKGRPRVPVIFLTGFADRKLEEEAQTLHPAAYVFKPIDTQQLLDLIETCLKYEHPQPQ